MVRKASQVIPSLGERLRALPRKINVADMFSGIGTFHLVMESAFKALKAKFPKEMHGVEARLESTCFIEVSLK